MKIYDVDGLLNCPAGDRNIPIARHSDADCQCVEDCSFWDVTLCSLVEMYLYRGSCPTPIIRVDECSLMMESASLCETLVYCVTSQKTKISMLTNLRTSHIIASVLA